MINKDRLAFFFLALLALFIWLRDVSWMSAADDTLPILAALPLFFWLGSPWHWRALFTFTGSFRSAARHSFTASVFSAIASNAIVSSPTAASEAFRSTEMPVNVNKAHWRSKRSSFAFSIKDKKILLALLFFLGGIAFNWTTFLAIGWTLLFWAWISFAFEPSQGRFLGKLMVLPLLAFPWISLDFDRLGWWFRLSGAWMTAQLFAGWGYQAHQEGTNVFIDSFFVNVEAACSGLNTLQSMLIAGVAAAYIILKKSSSFWLNLPLLVGMAWVSNVVRIVVLSLIALLISPSFAVGAFHWVGGWLILLLMFCLCWFCFALQKSPLLQHPMAMTRSLLLFQWALLFYCGYNSSNLVGLWQNAPFEEKNWLLFSIWASPLFFYFLFPSLFARKKGLSVPLFLLALFLSLLASMSSFNTLHYYSFAVALATLLPTSCFTWGWILLAICWMPAFGWLGSHYFFAYTFVTRIAVACFAAAGLVSSLKSTLPRV